MCSSTLEWKLARQLKTSCSMCVACGEGSGVDGLSQPQPMACTDIGTDRRCISPNNHARVLGFRGAASSQPSVAESRPPAQKPPRNDPGVRAL